MLKSDLGISLTTKHFNILNEMSLLSKIVNACAPISKNYLIMLIQVMKEIEISTCLAR